MSRKNENAPHARYPRTARVNQVLREVIAESLERFSDTEERLRLVTVTGVQTASDLTHATVFLSSLDEEVSLVLEELRAELQREIGSQVRMKRTPLLQFVADPGVAHGMRVEEILRRFHRHEDDAESEDSDG